MSQRKKVKRVVVNYDDGTRVAYELDELGEHRSYHNSVQQEHEKKKNEETVWTEHRIIFKTEIRKRLTA